MRLYEISSISGALILRLITWTIDEILANRMANVLKFMVALMKTN